MAMLKMRKAKQISNLLGIDFLSKLKARRFPSSEPGLTVCRLDLRPPISVLEIWLDIDHEIEENSDREFTNDHRSQGHHRKKVKRHI